MNLKPLQFTIDATGKGLCPINAELALVGLKVWMRARMETMRLRKGRVMIK